MEPFVTRRGKAALLDWSDVNTDLIIPARYLKRVERTGYGPLLFADKRYRPDGAVFHAEPGSLEWFLTERYCLYATDRGRLARAEIHHELWPLQAAEAEVELASIAPLELPDEPLVHFSRRQDVVIWPLEPVA